MFASLVLAAALGGSFVPAPKADQIDCMGVTYRRPANLASPPMYWFEPEAPWFARGLPMGAKSTPTNISDGVFARVNGAKWFQSYAGGAGNGTYAVYDTVSGAYYACAHQDTTMEFEAFEIPIGWVARSIPSGAFNLSLRTDRGIHFGMSRKEVEAIYGPAKSIPAFYRALSYTKTERMGNSNTTWTVTTTFYFDGHGLVGFDREAGI